MLSQHEELEKTAKEFLNKYISPYFQITQAESLADQVEDYLVIYPELERLWERRKRRILSLGF